MDNPIDQLFDSRDLIEYLEYLETELLDLFNDSHEYHGTGLSNFSKILESDKKRYRLFREEYSDEIQHYLEIKDFHDELAEYSIDFEHGETIIREDYFTNYCEDFVKDCGYLPNELPSFIENNIDWDGVAEDLAWDYTTVSYNGNDYYIR